MQNPKPSNIGIKQVRRRALSMSEDGLIKAECLRPDNPLPLVVQPAVGGVSLYAWAAKNREFIETALCEHGAVLFRGFGLRTADDLAQFVKATGSEMMQYRERSSPRHEVGDRVYTSTDYPADQSIFPHNEHSYSVTLPLKLFFFCVTPANQGGETPIADCRKIFSRISPALRERFLKRKWMYVRNFGSRFGLPWETVFQTTSRSEVEEYCRRHRIEFEWKSDNGLKTRQVRPAVAAHPKTGELVWFNHATFFHVSTLPVQVREGVLSAFKEEDLPNNTYYGDGSPIDPQDLDDLRAAYQQETTAFPWQQGDVLMLDNMLTAHSRAPYAGPRKILVAMADPFDRTDI